MFLYLVKITSIIFSLVIIMQCSLDESLRSDINSFASDDEGNEDYFTLEYKSLSFNFHKKDYLFLEENLFSKQDKINSNSNYGHYYRVYYSKSSRLLKKVYEYRHHQLISVILYKYTKDGNRLEGRHYLEDGRLFIVDLYKNNRLFKRRKILENGQVAYITLPKFIKKGMSEVWYTPSGLISYVIHYNKYRKVVRYAYYNFGILNKVIDYKYDGNQVLVRQNFYDKKAHLLHFINFYYNDKGYLTQSKTYKKNVLYSKTDFDLSSRERRIEEYDKKGSLSSYAIITYNDKSRIKITNWFDKNGLSLKRTKYKNDDKLIEHIEYGNGEREIKLIKNYFNEKGLKKKSNVYHYGNLKNRRFFDDNGYLEKEEIFNSDSLTSYFIYSYNKKGHLLKKEQFSPQNYYIKSTFYSYNKKNDLILEKIMDGKKVIGVRSFEYDRYANLTSIKLFNDRKQLVRREFIDSFGRIYRVENGLNGLLDNVVLYRFNRDGSRKVVQEEHYGKYDNLVRVLTFVYDNDGRIVREDGFDSKKQYIGSIIYKYNNNKELVRQIRIDHLKEPYEVVYFDIKTGKIKNVSKLKRERTMQN